MRQRNLNPEFSDEVRESINAAFGAITQFHDEVTASAEKVVAKIAHAARALGWPDHVVSGLVNQMQGIAQMQIEMMHHTMEVWRAQIRAWPSLTSAGQWPSADALKAMLIEPFQFWTRTGEQWQKNLAHMMMSQWEELSKRNVSPKSHDRE